MNHAIRLLAILLLIGTAQGCAPSTLQTKGTAITSKTDAPPPDSLAIRLSNVPEPLSLPGRKGANRILTATVHGGPVASVWLAPVTAPWKRVRLTRADADDYQVNLLGSYVGIFQTTQGSLISHIAGDHVARSMAPLNNPGSLNNPVGIEAQGDQISVLHDCFWGKRAGAQNLYTRKCM